MMALNLVEFMINPGDDARFMMVMMIVMLMIGIL